jgi:hypothetical protein
MSAQKNGLNLEDITQFVVRRTSSTKKLPYEDSHNSISVEKKNNISNIKKEKDYLNIFGGKISKKSTYTRVSTGTNNKKKLFL